MNNFPPAIVAVVNNKGGVGKTTCTTNLAYHLGLLGLRVLVIDNDPQSDTTDAMLGEIDLGCSLTQIWMQDAVDLNACIHATEYENVYILPNTEDTAWLEPNLYKLPDEDRYTLLRRTLREHIIKNFDICLVDCPPNMGVFSLNAMTLADSVLVPVEGTGKRSLKGLDRAIDAISTLKQELNPELRFLRILVNKGNRRTVIGRKIVRTIESVFGRELMFENHIPKSTIVDQAEGSGTVIGRLPGGGGSKPNTQFKKLTKELVTLLAEG